MLTVLRPSLGGIVRDAAKRLFAVLVLGCWPLAAASAQVVDGCRVADVNDDGAVGGADVRQVDALVGAGFAAREDLDGDGQVTAADRSLVRSFCSDPSDPLCADLNACGQVCSLDFDDSGALDAGDREAIFAAFGHPCHLDLNRDGYICPRDLVALEGYIKAFEGTTAPLPAGARRADFDQSGHLGSGDRAFLLQYLENAENNVDPTCWRDLDRDGTIDLDDVMALLGAWNDCLTPPREVSKPDQCNTADFGERRLQRPRSR